MRAIDGFVRAEFATDTYQILAQRYFDEPGFSYINTLARLSPWRLLRWPATALIYVARGVPAGANRPFQASASKPG